MRRFTKHVTALSWAALIPSSVYAQASIKGTVNDASGAVLPGVVVEAASPALIEKVRSVVTEGTGQYRIVDLRPGVYSITFTLAGFGPVKREGIELTGAFTATVNAELKVGALEEQVTVTGESPIVDVQNVRQQRVVSKDLIDTLPSARTTLSLTVLVPGVVGGAFGPVDVGGTSSIGLFSSTIHGGRGDDYRTQIEGFHLGSSYANFG